MRYLFPMLLLALSSGGCDPYPREPAPARHTILSAPMGEFPTQGIRDGTLVYPARHALAGQPMGPGPDPYGYDYLKHSFRGFFENRSFGATGLLPVERGNVTLNMLWNDAWLSNMDNDGDGRLDRHYGNGNYRGSGAWLTVHMEGEGTKGAWAYFMKVAAVPEEAILEEGMWVVNGEAMGPAIWGCFAVIVEFSTSPRGYEYAERFKRRFPGLGLE